MKNKRRIAIILAINVLISWCLVSCSKEEIIIEEESYDFSVTYLSVGQGDSCYITFPDGKNMLIDCGNNDSKTKENIKKVIKASNKTQIDYFVLTHTGSDHTGNMGFIANEFIVKKAFIPHVKYSSAFPEYFEQLEILKSRAEKVEYSSTNVSIKGEDYFIAFLSPYPLGITGSFYNDVNSSKFPTATENNNISAIIYLEYKGIRFLFLADSGNEAQQFVYDNSIVKLYSYLFIDGDVNLEGIDFLKVAHHGSRDSFNTNFHLMLQAKNCIISVGGGNAYGHPHTEVLSGLYNSNPDCKILRTDIYGNICVKIKDEIIKTTTDKGEV